MKTVLNKIEKRIDTIKNVYTLDNFDAKTCIKRFHEIREEIVGCVDLTLLTASEASILIDKLMEVENDL